MFIIFEHLCTFGDILESRISPNLNLDFSLDRLRITNFDADRQTDT